MNDPTTAVQVIDQLHDLLRRLATRPLPGQVRVDRAGRCVLLVPAPRLSEYLDLAVTEIGRWGGEDDRIRARMLVMLRDVHSAARAEHRDALALQIAEWGGIRRPKRSPSTPIRPTSGCGARAPAADSARVVDTLDRLREASEPRISQPTRRGVRPMSVPTDPTFYRSARDAAAAPAEELAYVVAFDRAGERPDAMTVVDVRPESDTYGQVVGWTDVPGGGELHHFGWNACSSALKHEGHDMAGLARRYLLVPGLRSSDLHVLDTQPDPRSPRWSRPRAEELSDKAGYSRPHTLHCGPDGVFLTCLGGPRATTTARAGSRCSTTRPSTCCGPGRPIADRSTSTTTPGGISTRTC